MLTVCVIELGAFAYRTATGQERTVGLSHSQGMAARVHREGQIALAQAPACLSQNLNLS